MAVATILPPPRFVVYNQLGDAAAGGFIHTYEVGTTTPRLTWQDEAESIPNANPVVLDADGSCLLYGAGSYTVVTTDSAGNLIPAYCGLSQDIAALVAVETARALAAEAVLQAEIDAETARATAEVAQERLDRDAADAALEAAIVAEAGRALAAEAVLQAEIDAIPTPTSGFVTVLTGTGTSDVNGFFSITFTPNFDNACLTVTGFGDAANPNLYYLSLFGLDGFPTLPSVSGANGQLLGFTSGGGMPQTLQPLTGFVWTATGW